MPNDKVKSSAKLKKAYNYLTQKGMEPHIAAGFIGNFMQESGFYLNPDTKDKHFTNSDYYGIAQWGGKRLQNLKERHPDSYHTLDAQLDFLMWELENYEKNNYKKILGAKTAEEAAHFVSKFFERPNPKWAMNEKRAAYGSMVYNSFRQKEPPKEEKQEQTFPKFVVPRRGVRRNPGGSESTHLMAAETFDGKNWYGFPTLFQDPDGKWVDMSNEPRKKAFEEAKKRKELYEFGTDKESALAFGKGSWKDIPKSPIPERKIDNTRVKESTQWLEKYLTEMKEPQEEVQQEPVVQYHTGGFLHPHPHDERMQMLARKDNIPTFQQRRYDVGETLEQYKEPEREQPMLKGLTEEEYRKGKEWAENIEKGKKEDIALGNIYGYVVDPLRTVGDFVQPFVDLSPTLTKNPFPTSKEWRHEILKNRYNPHQTSKERADNHWKIAMDNLPQAVANAGFGLLAPKGRFSSVFMEVMSPIGDIDNAVTTTAKTAGNVGKDLYYNIENLGKELRRNNINKEYVSDLKGQLKDIKRQIDDIWQEVHKTNSKLRNQPGHKKQLDMIDALRVRKERLERIVEALESAGMKAEDGKIISNAPRPTAKSLRQGEAEIMNFKTGRKVPSKVHAGVLKKEMSLVDNNVRITNKGATETSVSDNYASTLLDNISHIESTIPGAKVFGSAVGAAKAKLPHIAEDFDTFISREDYNKHVMGKLDETGRTMRAVKHRIKDANGNYVKGPQGEIDFNIIEAGKNGKATGIAAIELFRQVDPEGFYKATRKQVEDYIDNGTWSAMDLPIPYTPKQLLDKLDPVKKTIMDAYESGKEKHLTKIDAYIDFADPKIVSEAQESYVKTVAGPQAKVGHKFPKSQLSDVERNMEALHIMGYKGDMMKAAKSPERMQLILNDYYINNTILGRGVDIPSSMKNSGSFSFSEKMGAVDNAMKEWHPKKSRGGNAFGAGLNHVVMGNSGYGPIYSFKQIHVNPDINDPLSYVQSIKRNSGDDYTFLPHEKEQIKDIIKRHSKNPNDVDINLSIDNTARLIQDLSYRYDIDDMSKVLTDIDDELGIRMMKGDLWDKTTEFAGTTGKFNEDKDIISYLMYDLVPHSGPKSLKARKQALGEVETGLREIMNSDYKLDIYNTSDVSLFKNVYGRVNSGMDAMRKKIEETKQMINAHVRHRTETVSKINRRKQKNVDELSTRRFKMEDELAKLEHNVKKLDRLKRRMRDTFKKGMIAAGVTGLSKFTYETLMEEPAFEDAKLQARYEAVMNRNIISAINQAEDLGLTGREKHWWLRDKIAEIKKKTNERFEKIEKKVENKSYFKNVGLKLRNQLIGSPLGSFEDDYFKTKQWEIDYPDLHDKNFRE